MVFWCNRMANSATAFAYRMYELMLLGRALG